MSNVIYYRSSALDAALKARTMLQPPGDAVQLAREIEAYALDEAGIGDPQFRIEAVALALQAQSTFESSTELFEVADAVGNYLRGDPA